MMPLFLSGQVHSHSLHSFCVLFRIAPPYSLLSCRILLLIALPYSLLSSHVLLLVALPYSMLSSRDLLLIAPPSCCNPACFQLSSGVLLSGNACSWTCMAKANKLVPLNDCIKISKIKRFLANGA
eukprot:gnl/MRDRNA2_/MRDRNA2_20646_c0_seq1.p1 gnl/MRDRNA2_/MRDRNA2_20646_c0~~gnl/MRDRNA2_/MRDRNA2_20646_c0_seq1.p1  ORF type:complete len:125 (-),score=5.95 gnl/MRDRNA2_/MRDRNA2_20646_c0_seq1:13-387(-)